MMICLCFKMFIYKKDYTSHDVTQLLKQMSYFTETHFLFCDKIWSSFFVISIIASRIFIPKAYKLL